MPVGQISVREHGFWTRTLLGQATLNLWPAECQGHRQRQHRTEHTCSRRIEIKIPDSARDNTGHNTDKWHTPSPGIEIKISDPVGNRTTAPGLDGTYSKRVIIMYNSLHSKLYE